MNRQLTIAATALLCLSHAAWSMTPEERESYRAMLLVNLPEVQPFDDWIRKTNELPPDFDALPRHNALPDPLTFFSGTPVKTAEDWTKPGGRREEILSLYQKYVWGTVPPHPKFDHADVTTSAQQGYSQRTVVLHVGPEGKGTMRCTIQIPDGKGPFPVVMGPGLAGGAGRGGGAGGTGGIIRSHGYIVASLSASDGNDDSANIAALYPDADAGTLPRRGWAASTVVDYLLTLPEVEGKHIAITGYSRDGKMATIGAALDTRIAAVIAGSPGVGGILPFRLAGERNMAESIQSTTLMFPDWFHPRLRFFAGREDRLPVDGNLLLAAIAPRPFFLVAGLNDEVSNDWGDEQSFHSAEKVYRLLEGPAGSDKLGIQRVPGYHGANDWNAAMTFLDNQFGKSDKKWTNQYLFNWSFDAWKNNTGTDAVKPIDISKFPAKPSNQPLAATKAQWESKLPDIKKSVQWMLGDPRGTISQLDPIFNPWGAAGPPDVAQWAIRRSVGAQAIPEFGWYADDNDKVSTRPITFGNGIKATLYYPKDAPANAKLATVIWLHSFSYPLGYTWVYHRELHPILGLAENGYAVLAYDQTGFGTRMIEAQNQYRETPDWSQMGHMVKDVSSAIDAVAKDDALDAKRVYLFGYALGGSVALHAAALEPRVAGVVSIAGFTPMRTDTPAQADSINRYSTEHPVMPRLGLFLGHENQIPYDYDELIAAIAPRPVYILAPKYDRDANPADVHAAVENARKVFAIYNADAKLKLDEPWDYNRLSSFAQDRILVWMTQNMK